MILDSYCVKHVNALDAIIATVVGDMITFQHNDWAGQMDCQLVGAGVLVLLALFGVTFDMTIPPWLPVCLSAFTGSTQALFARAKKGYIKGVGALFFAFIGGNTAGILMGYSLGSMMGLGGDIAIILPVYIFSLIGGRLVLYISTGLSVEPIADKIVGWFIKPKS